MKFDDFTDGNNAALDDYVAGYASDGGDGSDRRWKVKNLRPTVAAFYAHKGGTDQTSFPSAAYTQLTFGSEYFDVGGYFDTANNYWTPPAGYVAMHASIYETAHAATSSGTTVGKIRRFHTGVTITIASPGVVTWAAHGLVADQPIQFETTGSLPTGITAGNVYYVLSSGLTADTFQFATSRGGAAVNTTGSQSGTQRGYCDVGAGIGTAIVGLSGFAIAHVGVEAAYTNGTDHFEVIFFSTSDGSAQTIDGNPAHTHFSGHWFGS